MTEHRRIIGSPCVTARRRNAGAGMLALFALALIATSAPAGADNGSVKRGGEMARRLCSPCHAILAAGKSPNPKAPPFRTLVARLTLEGIEDVLAEELALGHDPMPRWSFSNRQLMDLVDYIASLNK